MSRNVSGTYTLPAGNPVVSGTTILASWANTTLSDLATEVTDSLSRSGKGAMLADLAMGGFRLEGLASGTVGDPAIQWAATEGLYKVGTSELGIALNSQKALSFSLYSTAPEINFSSALYLQADTGSSTGLYVVPPSGGSGGTIREYGASDPNNAPFLEIKQNGGTDGVTFDQSKVGTGSYGSMTWKVNGAVAMRLETSGYVYVSPLTSSNDQIVLKPGTLEVANNTNGGGRIDLKYGSGAGYGVRIEANNDGSTDNLKITTNGGTGKLLVDGTPLLGVNNVPLFGNAVRNPSGLYGDRYASGTLVASTSAMFVADGWQVLYSGTTGRVQRDALGGSSVSFTCSTSDGTIGASDTAWVAIRLEGLRELLTGGTDLVVAGTISWTNFTGPMMIAIGEAGTTNPTWSDTINAEGDFSFAVSSVGGLDEGLAELRFALCGGSSTDYNGTGNFFGSTLNVVTLGSLRLTQGSIAPNYTALPGNLEYLRNLRRYQKLGSGELISCVGVGTSTTNIRFVLPFPVKMDGAPTVSLNSGFFGTTDIVPNPTTTSLTAVSTVSDSHAIINVTGTGIVAGQAYVGTIDWNVELSTE